MTAIVSNIVLRRSLAIAGLALALYGALFVIGNRTHRAVDLELLGAATETRLASDRLSVTTWNIGYGALGAESDFVADGGDHLLPPNRQVVDKNITGIVGGLNALNSDVVIMQEVAGASQLTRGANPLRAINASFAGRDNAFSNDFAIRFAPPPYSPRHGLYSSIGVEGAVREIIKLPLEPGYMLGVAKRRYHLHVIRLPFPEGEWSIINLHLSAFDDGADIRRQQLHAVLEFAEKEYAAGRHVVVGGDWNLEFARPARPTTTTEEFLFWIHPFPENDLSEGWQIAVDATTPTVRTNERPYRRGENFTTIIDGFVVSPNVAINSVETHDTDFQFTDHQPTTAVFMAVTP